MRNAYPNDYVESYYQFAQQNKGITFSRAGYMGAQRFPAHWAGDERSTFGAFRRSLLAGLSAGLSGVIFWGWDLGGFSGDVPTAELFIRSTQMAAFCPIMQYHAESKAELNQDRTPWNIAERSGDDRAISVYRYFANLRMSLLPYIEQEAKYSVESGLPLMRPLVLDYQEDTETHEIWDEYLFGRSLLIAPIVEEGARSRSVYLPKGRWFELFEERWFQGGSWADVEVPLERIPVFVKENTLLPLNMPSTGVLGDAMSSEVDRYDNLMEVIYKESKEAE
jgi:alpha-glucosidase (family GH31 glycosyl hydrolase)